MENILDYPPLTIGVESRLIEVPVSAVTNRHMKQRFWSSDSLSATLVNDT